MTRYTVIWRIDGDFSTTELDTDLQPESSNEWLHMAIVQDAEEMSFSSEEDKQEYLESCFNMALDSDHSDFIGYELIGVLQHPEGTAHMPWVAL